MLRDAHESGDRYVDPGSAILLKCLVRRKVVGSRLGKGWAYIGYIQQKIYQVNKGVIHHNIDPILILTA